MISVISCPMCGSTLVGPGPPTGSTLYAYRCQECNTVWTDRRPLDTATAAAADAAAEASAPERRRILVVDDHPEITALLRAWLSDIGDVQTATTSEQALVLAKALRPDVAIVDIILPRMDGFTVVDELRRIPGLAMVPVVLITGSSRADVGVRAVDVGAAVVLYKPLDEDVLRDAVQTLLIRREDDVS